MRNSQILIVVTIAVGLGLALSGFKIPWRGAPASPMERTGTKLGYFSPGELPDTIALLPPPPTPGSKAMDEDEIARAAALVLNGTPRYALATADADLDHLKTTEAFQCAFGTAITADRTPRLYRILALLRLDVRAASYPAKSHFKRLRPFVVHGAAHTCYRDDEATSRDDWSYPSARGAVGWAYALVLADLRPDRADLILKRGRDFGESRVICDQEWESDIKAGRTVAAVMVGKLEANEAYKADFAAARKEIALQLAAGIKPALNCAPEFAALTNR